MIQLQQKKWSDQKLQQRMDNPGESKTLWLGDLQIYMDQPYLTSLINTLGYSQHLASVKIIKDKQTGIPAKYGFIEFNSHPIAERFLQEFNGKIIPNTPGKYFKLKWAAYGGGVKPTSINLTSTQGELSIYVGDLDLAVSEAKLFEFFKNKYASVYSAKIITDPTTKQSKGYGFIKFTNQDQSQRAIAELNGQILQGKPIKVSHAYTKTKEQQREQQQENQTQAGQIIRVYQQFYSMMNDPIIKSTYENQLLRSTGQQINKKTFKQQLQTLKTLSYNQTKPSEQYTESLSRVVCFNSRKQIERRILM